MRGGLDVAQTYRHVVFAISAGALHSFPSLIFYLVIVILLLFSSLAPFAFSFVYFQLQASVVCFPHDPCSFSRPSIFLRSPYLMVSLSSTVTLVRPITTSNARMAHVSAAEVELCLYSGAMYVRTLSLLSLLTSA